MGVEGSSGLGRGWVGTTLHKGERDAFFRKGRGDSVVMLRQEGGVGAGAGACLNE